jgi:hypothetical protein
MFRSSNVGGVRIVS